MLKQGEKIAVLSFDTESDIGSWTQRYSSIDLAMPLILDVLHEKGIPATFVWEGLAARHGPDMLRRTARQGHECGCHSYQHETVGSPSYFIPGDRPILPEEFPLRLSKNVDIVQGITGQKPTAFRAPRLWGNCGMLRELEAQGFQTDSTYAISQASDSLFPYHPDRNDIAKEGSMNILEIPVSGLYGDMLREVDEDVLLKTGGHPCGSQWPVLRLQGGDQFARYFDPLIREQMRQRGYSVICVFQHPWEFIDMPAVIECPEGTTRLDRTLHEHCGAFALKALADFIDRFCEDGFRFVTMAELRNRWARVD